MPDPEFAFLNIGVVEEHNGTIREAASALLGRHHSMQSVDVQQVDRAGRFVTQNCIGYTPYQLGEA